MMLVSAALLVASGLSLEMASPQQSVLVGEPVRIVLHWKATADVPVVLAEDSNFLRGTVVFRVESGAGAIVYRECPRSIVDQTVSGTPLAKGQEVIMNHVLLRGSHPTDPAGTARQLLFPAPGEYQVRAVHVGPGAQGVESNALAFSVSAPTGDESVVWDLLQREPALREGGGRLARLQEVVQAYPASRYLGWARVELYERRGDKLNNRYDPDTGESFWRLDPAALASALASRFREMVTALDGASWGPFEEERLSFLMVYARGAGAFDIEQRVRNEILERFPTSQTAAGIREREAGLADAARFNQETDDTPPPSDDTTPPTLALSASPSSLWPPNHKMVAVTVTVNVKDNVDPNPVVKLVSITCDDGCNPAQDVAGATLNTDGRQFQLRAERLGAGAGRTYTINYSAKDAAGNTTTKTTTVTVPHDQGK